MSIYEQGSSHLKKLKTSKKAGLFRESVIREMTRLVNAQPVPGVNLAQGFPDFPAPDELKEAAIAAIRADVNQYAITWGHKDARAAIAQKFERTGGFSIDPEREVTVCCGATETMISAFLACVDPGDEVVIFEPFYENYGPDAILSGAVPRFVRLSAPDFEIPWDELERAFTTRTKAIVINTPNNPTGKVFTRAELTRIAELCVKHDVLAITDEIYEHIVYDGAEHVILATLPGMSERTITVNALSKTYSVTGWRVGYAIASPEITNAIRKVHDFLTVGAPAPLQKAVVAAMSLPESYYTKLCGRVQGPPGLLTRRSRKGRLQVREAARRLLHHVGLLGLQVRRRRPGVCALLDREGRCRGRSWFELLQQSRGR